MKAIISAFVSGALFSLGLVLGGMTQPAKVIGFLDLFGHWDPTLLFVMAGAVLVHFVAFRLITKRNTPWFADHFHLPTRKEITPSLIIGAVIFGVGWGMSGYCPGPALVSLAAGPKAVLFVLTMALGMFVFAEVERRWLQRRVSQVSTAGEVKEVEAEDELDG